MDATSLFRYATASLSEVKAQSNDEQECPLVGRMSSWLPVVRFPYLFKQQTGRVSAERVASDEQPSDDVLIARIVSDDPEALGLLFRRYARLVWSIARRIVRNNEDADDLLQDVFLLVRKKASVFDSEKGAVRSLLVQMAYQRALSRRRDLSRRQFYSSEENVEDIATPKHQLSVPQYDQGLEAHIGRATLKRAFEDLSSEQRETVRLCFFEGYTLEEIAVYLGVSYGNVRHHYYRALAKLRKHAGRE
jgi:RNA polymerase sigma-70 factor (ECF subfamily)